MTSTEIQSNEFENEALRIVESASKNNVTLRIMGAIAVRLHCKECRLLGKIDRKVTDLDFAGYSKQKDRIGKHFMELGYAQRPLSFGMGYSNRLIFTDEKTGRHADVFLDELRMCHTIKFRLENDYPTIPLDQLVLEKLQIVKINEKDVKDMVVILADHDLASDDNQIVRGIASALTTDWGFYYTVKTNIEKIAQYAKRYFDEGFVQKDEYDRIHMNVSKMLARIEGEPKSLGWRVRAKAGTSKKWYRDVDNISH